jgi:hypothetical protein
MKDAAGDDRSRQIRQELTARLAPFRGHMTDAEFGKLVTDVGRTAERFTALDADPARHVSAWSRFGRMTGAGEQESTKPK